MRGIFGIDLSLEQIAALLFLFIVVILIVVFVSTTLGNLTRDQCWADVGKTVTKITLRLKGPQLPIYEREEGNLTVELGKACAESLEFVNHPIGREYRAFWSVCDAGESYILGLPIADNRSWFSETVEKATEKLAIKNLICESFSLPFEKPIKLVAGKPYCLNIKPVKSGDKAYQITVTEGKCG